MKNILFVLIVIPFIISGQTTFQKTYGLGVMAMPGTMARTTDGGIIMVGTSWAQNSGDVYVVKTDSLGVQEWTHVYDNLDESGANINPTSDGGAIVIGSYDDGAHGTGLLLLKIGATGTLDWANCYSVRDSWGMYSDYGNYVLQTSDNGFLATGVDNTNGVYLFKTDQYGTVQWSRVINGGGGVSIKKTSDGNYALLGFAGNAQTYLAKFTLGGTFLWEKLFYAGDGLSDFKETMDKGFIISGGLIYPGNPTNSGGFLMKTDSAGNFQWAKKYRRVYCRSVVATKDGGYAFTAGIDSTKNCLLYKTSANGSVQWGKAYGDTTSSHQGTYSNSLLQTNDEGYLIFGGNDFLPGGSFFLIKTDSVGNSNCNQFDVTAMDSSLVFTASGSTLIDTLGNDSQIYVNSTVGSGSETVHCYTSVNANATHLRYAIKVYPNPAADRFSIESNSEGRQTIFLYDVNGRLVFRKDFTDKTLVDCTALERGVYSIEIRDSAGVVGRKLVILQ